VTLHFFFCSPAAQRASWPPHSWGFYFIYIDAPQSVGLFWKSVQLVAKTSLTDNTQHSQEISITAEGFEPTVPASERPQTHALDLGHWERRVSLYSLQLSSVTRSSLSSDLAFLWDTLGNQIKAEVSCYKEKFYGFIKLLALSPEPRSAKIFVS
jgi:hypothetical protein